MTNNYDRVVIFCYPSGAGGKFLNNCLALNDEFVFSDYKLARQQLQGKFSVNDKILYLQDRLESSLTQKTWNDLELGCRELTGLNEPHYLTLYQEILSLRLNQAINEIINANLWFGIVAHTTLGLEATLRFWPNAKVIFFTNSKKFLTSRGVFDQVKDPSARQRLNYWNIIKGPNWPEVPPSDLEDFELLDDSIKQELQFNFDNEIFKYFNLKKLMYPLFERNAIKLMSQLENQSYNWHTDTSYHDLPSFLSSFDQCCKWLGVTHPGNDKLSDYFNKWQQVIKACI